MKNLFAICFMFILLVQLSYGQGVFNSAASGSWNAAASWTLISGTDSDGIPDSDDDVTVLNTHTINLPATVSAKNVTINSGGSIVGPGSGTAIYYLRIYGTNLINNGNLGGTDAGTRLGLEPANNGGTVTLSGTGTCEISQMRTQSAASNMTFVIDQNMKINRTWSRGLGFTGFQGTGSIGNTIMINTGRTVTLDSTADFHLGSTTAAPSTGGNTTYIINGTLKTESGQRFIIMPFSADTSTLTIEVNGTLDLGGPVFSQRHSSQTVVGSIFLNVNNNGVLKVTGVPSSPEMDISDVKTTLVGTGYFDIGSWNLAYRDTNYIKITGTGGFKRQVGSSNVIFPIGTVDTYNPITISNLGTADKFTTRVKSTFDNLPVDPNKVVNRQWTIDEEVAGGSNATLTFQWNSAQEAAGFTRNTDLVISRYTGANWAGTSATLGGTDPYTATGSGFTTFSNFIVESRNISSFRLSAGLINFGVVNVGSPKTDSVYVKNVGSVTLNISNVASDNSVFTVFPTSANIPAGDSTKFKVTFAPSSAGPATGNISFTHDGGGSPHTLTVSGTGVVPVPVFSVNPKTISYGTVVIGRSKIDSIVVTNNGNLTLLIDSIRSFSNDFSINPVEPVTIPPTANQKFYITFSPTTEGTQTGQMRFFSNSLTSPDTVALTGTGMVFRTIVSNGTGGGNWAITTTWQGGSLPSVVDSVVILGSDSVFVLADITTGALNVQAGGRINLLDTLRVVNGTIGGTVIASGTASASALIPSGTMTFLNGGLYIHALPQGIIPRATWNDGSICRITGYTSGSKPGNLNQNFHHFVWDCSGQTANQDLSWYYNTIGGNITIKNTGNARIQMTSPTAGTPNVITILGDILVEAGQFSSNGSSGAADITVHTYGNMTATGGNFSVSRGSGPDVVWYFYGNFSMLTGTSTNNSKPAGAKFIAAGTTPQNINFSGMTFNGTVPIEINSGTTLNVSLSSITYEAGGFAFTGKDGSTINFGTNILQGTGYFALNSGATLVSAHASGLNGTLQNTGALTLNPGANYVFNGTVAQVTGAKMPPTVGSLTINNAIGVTLSNSTTVNGVLSLPNGDLTLGSNTLTLGSSGTLSETAGNTVWGKVVTTRTVAQSVNNTFGGIGIEINAAGAEPGSTLVERVTGVAQTGNAKSSILRYFNISPTTNIGLNATIVFRYDDSELAGQDANTLQLFKSEDGGLVWSGVGGTPNAGQKTITATGVNSFSRWTAADVNNSLAFFFTVGTGWNMVSVPLKVADYSKAVLFPTAQSSAFSYQGNYVANDILQNTIGYWVKFSSNQNIFMNGSAFTYDSVNVSAGWNMIGSLSVPISKTEVTTSPGVTITSPFYTFQGGYIQSEILHPGRAYWVKTNAPGKIYLGGAGK